MGYIRHHSGLLVPNPGKGNGHTNNGKGGLGGGSGQGGGGGNGNQVPTTLDSYLTGLSATWSYRKLVSTYAGFMAQNATPTDYTFASPPANGTENMQRFYDQSSAGENCVATTSTRPTWNGLGRPKGNLYFGGNITALSEIAFSSVSKTTVYLTCELGVSASLKLMMESNLTGAGSGWYAGHNGAGAIQLISYTGGGTSYAYNLYNTTTAATKKVRAFVIDNTQAVTANKYKYYEDGVLLTPTSTTVIGTPPTIAFDAAQFSIGCRATGPAYTGIFNALYTGAIYNGTAHDASTIAAISAILAA